MYEIENRSRGESRPAWWTLRGVESARAAHGQIADLKPWHDREMSTYVELVDIYERERWMYEWLQAYGINAARGQAWQDLAELASHQIVKSAIDTLTARLFSEVPTVSVRTRGADYDQRLRAERLQMVLDSVLDLESSQTALMEFGRDGLKTGIGLLRVVLSGNAPRLDRVTLRDLRWNPEDARECRSPDRPPRTMYWRQVLSRGELLDQVADWEFGGEEPGKRKKSAVMGAIRAMSCTRSDRDSASFRSFYDQAVQASGLRSASEMVEIWHCWHLPADRDSDDGRYLVIAFGAGEPIVIADQRWAHAAYPIVWWQPYAGHAGLVGEGHGHVLRPYQYQIDQAWQRIQESVDVFGKSTLIVDEGQDQEGIESIVSPGINLVRNKAAAQMPGGYTLVNHQARPADLMGHIVDIENKALAAVGLNSGVMQGGSQLGPNVSGVALRVEDTRSDLRFADVLKRFDQALIAVGNAVLDELDRVCEAEGSWAVSWEDRWGYGHEDQWGDLRMDAGRFSLEITGASVRSKAQRIRILEEWATRQAITPEVVQLLTTGAADEEAGERHANAGVNLVEWQLFWTASTEDAEELARYAPDEWTDLAYAKVRARAEIQIAKVERADDDTLGRLINYATHVEEMLETARQKAMEEQAAAQMQAQPPGVAGAPMLEAGAAPVPSMTLG